MVEEPVSQDGDVVGSGSDYEATVRKALDAVIQARDDLRTGAPLKKAWRSLIAAYSAKPDALNFPLFASERLDDEIIIEALQAEFGAEAVGNLYHNKKAKSNIVELASLLGLPDARLLALWFGADDIRTPTRETRTKIYNYLSSDEHVSAVRFLEHEYPKIVRRWGEKMDLDLTTPHGRIRCVFARTPFQDLPKTPRLRLSPKDFGLRGKVHFAPINEATAVVEDESVGSEAAGSADEENGSAESEADGSEDGEEDSVESKEGGSEDGDDDSAESEEDGSDEDGSEEDGSEEDGSEDDGSEDDGSEDDGSEDSDAATSLILGELDVVSSPTGQSEALEPAPQPVPVQRPSPQAKEPHLTPADDDTSTIFVAGDVGSPVTGKSTLKKESSARPTPALDQPQHPALGGESSTQKSQVPPSNTLAPDRHKEALLPSVEGPLTPRPSISGMFDSFSVTEGLDSNTSANPSSKGTFSDLIQRFGDTPMTELEQSSYLEITKKRKADLSFSSPTSKRVLHSPKDGDSVYSREQTTHIDVPDVDQLPDKKDANDGEVGTGDANASVSAEPEPSPVIVDVGYGEGQAAASMIAALNAPRQWLSGAVMSHFLAMITSMTPTHALVDIPSDAVLEDRHKADFAKAMLRGESLGPRKFLAAVNRQKHWVLVELEPFFKEPTELDPDTTAVMDLQIYDSMTNPAVSQDVTQTIQQLVPTGTRVRAKQPKCPQQSDGNSCGVFALVFSVFVVTKTPIPATLDIGNWRLILRAWAQGSSFVSLLPDNVLRVTHRRDIDPAIASPRFTEATNETPDRLADYRVADVSRLLRLTEALVEGNVEWYQTQQDHAAHVLEWVVTEAMPILSTLTASAVREEKWLRQEEANLTYDIDQMKAIIEALGTMKGALSVRDLWAGANNGRLSEAERRLIQLRRRLEMCQSGTAPFEKLALPQLEQTLREIIDGYKVLVHDNQEMLGSGIFAGLRALA